MDLFSARAEAEEQAQAPLAYRMRPRTLDEVVGQAHLVGPDGPLRRAIEADRLWSVLLYGPPGSGKTTLAEVIARVTKAHFVSLNAVTSGVGDIRDVVRQAQDERRLYGRRTVLFIDEIHRFNKGQQDALLPFVERGTITLIGATTENPYLHVNRALVSRSLVLQLQPLTPDDIRTLLRRALTDAERGLGAYPVQLTEDGEAAIVRLAGGDARRALNALEVAVLTGPVDAEGRIVVDAGQVAAAVQERPVSYDADGDEHYDTISAFIKSVRGSDADAALLWLAKMLAGGEDPRFIARRLVILASEDIGNADPQALVLAVAAMHAVEAIGMPEARIILAQATTYLAKAPKSNASYVAIGRALQDVQSGVPLRVPAHLRGTGYSGAEALGHGIGYKYPHDYPGHWVEQDYWPEGVTPRTYYEPDR